jgi:hypothetical protein
MNPVDSVPDADLSCRPGQDPCGPNEAADDGGGAPPRAGWAHRPLQDIQDLIDKLAAVTQQLRHPGSAWRDSSRSPDADRPTQVPTGGSRARLRSRRSLSAGLRAEARSSVKART